MKPVIIVGGGGHSRILIDILKLCEAEIIGITDPDRKKHGLSIDGIRVVGTDDELDNYKSSDVVLANGLGSIKGTAKRGAVYEHQKKKGFNYIQVIHPSAVISSSVVMGEGVQIMAGVVIQTGCIIGNNVLINTMASLDHDCRIGKNVHIAPGVTISGEVDIGDNVHIGAGATIIQGIKIGPNSILGAGSVVLGNIPANVTAIGVPAKVVKA